MSRYIRMVEEAQTREEEIHAGIILLSRVANHITNQYAQDMARLAKSTATAYERGARVLVFDTAITTVFDLQSKLINELEKGIIK